MVSFLFELLGALLELLCLGHWMRERDDHSIVGESGWDRDAKRFQMQVLLGGALIVGALWALGSWRHWW
jgi:hypothetical protein